MNRERLEQIGKFLEGRMVVHRNVEHDSPWTTEEKMIQELYDNYLDLLIEYGKQKEVIDKTIEYIKETKLKEFEKSFGKRYGKTFTQAEIIVCNMILDKMQELEGNDSND